MRLNIIRGHKTLSWIKEKFKFIDRNVLILIGIFIFSLPLLQPWVRGDGINYYAYIHSLVIDGDLHFDNEFKDALDLNQLRPPILSGIRDYKPTEHLRVPEAILPLTKTGYLRNRMSVGTSLLWSPFFLLAHFLVIFLNKLGLRIIANGYTLPYVLSIAFGSCLYGFIGLLLSYKICRRYFSPATSLIATIALWWASPLPAYMYGHPLLSHASSAFAISLLLFVYLKIRDRESSALWLAFGVIGGLAAIVRIQDSIFLLIPGSELLHQCYTAIKYRKSAYLLKVIKKNILFLIGFLLGILPQLIVGKILYGAYTLDFYHQMQNEIAWKWSLPPVLGIFFSSCHGLFSWTPILLFAVIGLYFFYKKDRMLTIISTIIFLLQVCIVSGGYSKITGIYIWQHSSFGGRMFLSFIPIFILGLAGLIENLKTKISLKWLIVLVGIFILWNLGFILQFGIGLLPREGYISWKQMAYNQFITLPLLIYKKIGRLGLSVAIFLVSISLSLLFILKKKRPMFFKYLFDMLNGLILRVTFTALASVFSAVCFVCILTTYAIRLDRSIVFISLKVW